MYANNYQVLRYTLIKVYVRCYRNFGSKSSDFRLVFMKMLGMQPKQLSLPYT